MQILLSLYSSCQNIEEAKFLLVVTPCEATFIGAIRRTAIGGTIYLFTLDSPEENGEAEQR